MTTSFAIAVAPELVAAASRGDRAAFERVYRLFERPAYTLALRLLGDPEQAREVLHDALLGAHGRLHQYRGDAPFWGWLRQIVVNTALMRLRKRRRSEGQERLLSDRDLCDQQSPPPALAAEAGALERALAALPDLTRSVVWLYCVEGYSHAEIAALMQQSVSFSKSQLARGLARLRGLLNVEQELTHA